MALNIAYYQDNEPRTTSVLNRPLAQLAAAVEGIQSSVEGAQTNSRLLIRDVPCSDTVQIGDVVYINNGQLDKAVAVWATDYGQDGQTTPALSAGPAGILIEKQGAVGTVLVKGLYTGSSLCVSMGLLTKGVYYLSANNPGKVETTISALKVQVLTLVDSDTFLVDIKREPSQEHTHKRIVISPAGGDWEANGDPTYTVRYKGASSVQIISAPVIDPVITVNGVINEDNYKIDYSTGVPILTAKTVPLSTDKVVLYTSAPCIRDQSVVRAITTKGSGRLRATSNNGIVTLLFDDVSEEDAVTEYKDKALHGYKDSGAPVLTPVVSKLTAGANTSIADNGNGQYTISTGYGSKTPIYPSTVALNGVSTVTLGGEMYYYYPSRAATGMTGTIYINPPADNQQYKVYPFVTAIGKPAAFSGASFEVTAIIRQVDVDIEAGNQPETPLIAGNLGSVAISAVQVSKDKIKTIIGSPFTTSKGGGIHLTVNKTTTGDAYLSTFGVVIVPENL